MRTKTRLHFKTVYSETANNLLNLYKSTPTESLLGKVVKLALNAYFGKFVGVVRIGYESVTRLVATSHLTVRRSQVNIVTWPDHVRNMWPLDSTRRTADACISQRRSTNPTTWNLASTQKFNDFYRVLFYRISSEEAQLPSWTGGRIPDSIDFVLSFQSARREMCACEGVSAIGRRSAPSVEFPCKPSFGSKRT